jgi:hypothetical protein
MGERRAAYRVLVGKREGKRPFRRPGRRWDGSSGRRNGGMDWVDLDQDRDRWWVLVKAVRNVWVP